MTKAQNNVLAIGNAIVDVLARVDNDFLDEHGMPKGGMTLIERAPGVSLEELKAKTGADYTVADSAK